MDAEIHLTVTIGVVDDCDSGSGSGCSDGGYGTVLV